MLWEILFPLLWQLIFAALVGLLLVGYLVRFHRWRPHFYGARGRIMLWFVGMGGAAVLLAFMLTGVKALKAPSRDLRPGESSEVQGKVPR